MEVDSPAADANPLSPRERIIQRLILRGVPEEKLANLQKGLVEFVRDNKSLAPQLVSSVLPSEEDVLSALKEPAGAEATCNRSQRGPSIPDLFHESLIWIQWLMFEDEPRVFLKNLAKRSSGQRGICGAVWSEKDIAYRCRTCEHDPTCAICVACFQNGNHEGHDYSTMYTGGGCCDCGDVTAWKREGFCSRHKGSGQIQPLPDEVANSMGPILDSFFGCWRDKLLVVDNAVRSGQRHVKDNSFKYVKSFSSASVEMLLDFCKHSESLLNFASKRILLCVSLLDILVRTELFLSKSSVKKLHELLLKLLGDPVFKYEFAKIFIDYYPVIVNRAIRELNHNAFTTYPLLSTFSVQIFTVPTLTLQLVKEVNLLGVLLGCVGDLFLSCIGEDGHLQPNKCDQLYDPTVRITGDIRFVLSHPEVQQYVFRELPNISKTWVGLTALVQGMDPQKRVIGLHVEEESEHLDAGFFLGHSLGTVHSLLVSAAFSINEFKENNDGVLFKMTTNENNYTSRHTKVGRLSQESCVSSLSGKSNSVDCVFQVPSSVAWLSLECLKTIEKWLWVNDASKRSSPRTFSNSRSSCTLKLRRLLSKIREDKQGSWPYCVSPLAGTGERTALYEPNHKVSSDAFIYGGLHGTESGGSMEATTEKYFSDNSDMDVETGVSGDLLVDTENMMDLDTIHLLAMDEWPDIAYDVSSQEISFHIPLHRLLSLLLQKLLKTCFEGSGLLEITNSFVWDRLLEYHHKFFGQILQECHSNGFSAFIMEHPLRLRVFCAQVRAGMWRKNGEAATSSCNWYHSANLWDRGLDSDLFLLQCCAAVAPPDLFVTRIMERYGLSNYLSLVFERTNEYEITLVQDMLTLIIQIVQERCYSGMSEAENLCRELVCKLAVADATHSQLLKALPHDLSKSDQLQDILERVAFYTNPSGLKQGRYSLRRAYWKELDLYHPRWNSRDLQIAEERYQRICGVCASNTQLPRWRKIYYPFYTISRIATCKAVLQIVRTVLFYAYFSDNPSIARAPDGVLLAALHLLSLALDICHVHKQLDMTSSGESSMDALHDEGKLIPLLAYATEEIDVAESMDTYSWKHQSMLSLLVSLMKKYKQDGEQTFMGENHCNFSLLIETLLKKLAELDSGCMNKLLNLSPDVVTHTVDHTPDAGSRVLMSASDSDERRAKIRERQAAILEKMKMEQSKFVASLHVAEDLNSHSSNSQVSQNLEDQAPLVCSLCHDPDSKSPVSFLILLQKSRLTSSVERGPPSWDGVCQSYREHFQLTKHEIMDGNPYSSSSITSSSQLVDFVHAAANEFSRSGQPADIDAILDFIKARIPTIRNIQLSDVSTSSKTNIAISAEMMENDMYQSIQRGVHDIIVKSKSSQGGLKLVNRDCEEGLVDNDTAKFDVLGEYAASLSQEMARYPSASADSGPQSGNMLSINSIQSAPFDGFGPTDCDGIYVSSCGHAVHQECRDRYLSSLRQRYVRRIVFERGQIVDPEQGEFLCPVCRKLANSVLPTFCNDSSWTSMIDTKSDQPLKPGYSSTMSVVDGKSNAFRVPVALSLLQSAADEVGKSRVHKICTPPNESICASLKPFVLTLCQMYFPGRNDGVQTSRRVGRSLLLWDSFRYSLIATEIAARDRGIKTFLDTGLEALRKELETSAGFILSSLLHVAQRSRSQNRLEVLLRFRGIQLFSSAISFGVSADEIVRDSDSRKDILRERDKWGLFPDIQFWKRAADPVLSHDPFSSLMWVLYCLPLPFLSSSESLLSLVHLFYVVCVLQALITCCLHHHVDLSELGFGDPVVNHMVEIMRGSIGAQQYFVSNFIDPSCGLKDMIRKFTHPYLRRCSLLWKLLKSSKMPIFGGMSYLWNQASSFSSDSTEEVSVEQREISELEQLFQISSLELIINDDVVHSLALKWCEHFCRDFGSRNYGRILHTTPAVPFRLLLLPQVYQDLLQRYIKQRCSECKHVIEDAALCLLCARLCCTSWKICCRENDCQLHAKSCGAGVGVFLLIKKTQMLLLRSARHAFWPSVYLDAFGEEDPDMKRGRPLYLNKERYAALTYMVASHGLDRSSEALRQTTMDISLNM